MDCRLTEMEVLGNQIHDGHILASGEGAVLVDPSADGEKDKGLLVRGRILGGGTALKPRPLGLVIGTENKSIRLSSQIGAAINKRFHTFEHGAKKGMATPKTDEFIEINLHPRYKDNISRYMRVVRSVPIKESTTEQVARLKLLERQLIDHVTAATAALRLEALGHDGVKTLLQGIGEQDPEVRFYSAEALAYLDEKQAAAPLAAAAQTYSDEHTRQITGGRATTKTMTYGGTIVRSLFLIIITLGFAALGSWAALRTGSTEAVQGLFPVFFVFLFLSSMNMPRNLIQADWFRWVATVNPVSYLVEAVRSLVIEGWNWEALALGFAAAGALSVIGFALSAHALYRRLERT
jgi:hypothetical protein